MNRYLKGAFATALLLQSAPLAVAADVTLNALYMNQAAYSEDDIRAMTADFEKANAGHQGQSRVRPLRGAARQDRRRSGRRRFRL